ncbi:phytanoyl-CoA dioxygenase family protein [Nocardioides sp. GY 10127]|nr:phytanoyl-CoA dioxygenase family protein [Nocardioides sp. GY 10127]
MDTATGLRTLHRSAGADAIFAVYEEDGGVIIEDLVSAEDLAAMNAELEPYLKDRAPGAQGGAEANEEFAAFYGAQTKRITQLVTRSATFREKVLCDPLTWELVWKVFPDHAEAPPWMCTAQIIEIGPGNAAQMLHRDTGNYPDYLTMGKSAPEVMFNFLFALTDFTEEIGATRVVPGSHTWDDYSVPGDPADSVGAEMKAGSALFFSGKVLHGGGQNSSTDRWRRALALPFNAAHLVPEEAAPFLMDLELVKTLPPHVQAALGFRSKGRGLWSADWSPLEGYLGL